MGRELIDIILRLRKEGTGARDVADELKDVDTSASKAKTGLDGIGSTLSKVAVVAGAAAGAFYTLKKAYDFGKEGAAILQTAESFDNLMASMGAAPDVLGQLRAASRGTVDDMTLMSSTMTLLAGTSETLGAAIVDASPQLMNIAKAANKLNPALGTTAQMYNSIATGVKRAQPLILDNLGLTLKVGDANEAYAKTLGKTVDALTAEEKTMAILAATLEAGDRMIAQVGGSTEAMGDKFAIAETQIANLADVAKTKLAPIMGGVAEGVSELALGFQLLGAAAGGSIPMMDYFRAGTEAQRIANEEGIMAAQEYIDLVIAQGGASEEGADKQRALAKETERVSEKWANYAAALRATPVQELTEDTADLAGNVDLLATMMETRAVTAADNFKGSMDNLQMAMSGEFGNALEEYRSELAELEGSLASGTITQDEYTTSVEKSAAALRDNTMAVMFNIAEKQILDALEKGLIEDVNASGTAYDEATTMLWTLGETMGLVDEETLALMESVQGQTQSMIDGEISARGLGLALADGAWQARDLAAASDEATAGIGRIPNYKQIVIEYHTSYTGGAPPSGEVGPGLITGPKPQDYQHGGQFLVRGPAGPDRVPVRFNATRGETVTVTPAGGQAPANPVTNYTWNNTIHSGASAGAIVRTFDIQQAMVN